MNDLNTIMPKVLARALLTLRGKLVMPRIINSDYSTDAAKKGAVINVPVPTAQSVTDVVPNNTKPALTDTDPTTIPITLDRWKMSSFHLSDKDLVQIDASENFLPMQTLSAIDALAEDINGFLLGLAIEIPSFIGTAGITPFASTAGAAIEARKVLTRQKAPKNERRFVLDLNAEANALGLQTFADASQTMENGVKIEGEIGRKYGFDFYSDQQVYEHTTGAAGVVLIDNGGGYAAGATAIHVDGLTTAFVKGDLLTIAGSSGQYTVVSVGALAVADQDIVITPALEDAVADNAAITVVDDHVANIAFHRDAFAYAQRNLEASTQNMAFGSKILSMSDPETGISLRLEITRVHKAVVWEFDVLYGGCLTRPELAVRVLG